MIETIYAIRHGDRPLDLSTGECPSGIRGDVCLTNHGKQQSQELADYFAENGLPLDLILCSPYYRALETAEQLAERLEIPIFVENGLQESILPDGLHPRIGLTDFKQARFPRISSDYEAQYLIGGGVTHENRKDHILRLQKAWNAIDRYFNSTASLASVKHVAIISHAGPIIALAKALSRNLDLSLNVKTAAINTFQRRPDGAFEFISEVEMSRASGPSGSFLGNSSPKFADVTGGFSWDESTSDYV